MKVCIIGSGSWGTAIFNLIKNNRYDVTLLSRNNLDILKEIKFDIAFIALRTEAIEGCLEKYGEYLPKKVCSLSKGIFNAKEPFLSNKMADLGFEFALLYGPNFADEVERKDFTISTIASKNLNFANEIKQLTEANFFEVEINDDVESIEIYGIFKNIIAIFMGFAEQSKMPQNTKSAIFTKLIQEMIALSKMFKKDNHTFFTSSGIGDLFLTISSAKSRNFNFGVSFANNANFIPDKTVEGLRSLSSILHIEKKYSFEFNYYRKLYDIFILKNKDNII